MSSLGKLGQAAWAGWNNRCPECNRGRIWTKSGAINHSCSECGLVFEPDEVDWGGFSWGYALEGLAVPIIGGSISLVLELFTDLEWVTHAYIWVGVLILFHLLFYRNMKGQWVGIRTALMGRPGSRV